MAYTTSDIGMLYPNFKPLQSMPISLPHFPLSVFLKIIHIIEKIYYKTISLECEYSIPLQIITETNKEENNDQMNLFQEKLLILKNLKN